MQNLLMLFARIGNLILFIFLEILCIYLIINYNNEQKSIFLNSSNLFSANLNKRVNNFTGYLKLRDNNETLAEENAKLLEELINLKSKTLIPSEEIDSQFQFALLTAQVINNSVRQKNNQLTLNKGRKHNIQRGMGVINEYGLVGIVNNVSENFSTAISILNLQSNISVRIKRTGDIGELSWDGRNIKRMTVSAIPPQVEVELADSIVTSGFSTIFPPNLYIGSVVNIEKDKRSGFLSLDVELNNNLSNLNFVYVITNIASKEQLELEGNG